MCNRRSQEEIKRLTSENLMIEILTPEFRTNERVDLKCLKCNHIWTKKLSKVLYDKYGCPNCHYTNKTASEKYIDMLLYNGMEFETTPDIIQVSKRYNIRCLQCGHTWNSRLDNNLYGKHGCPKCNVSGCPHDPIISIGTSDYTYNRMFRKRIRKIAAIKVKGGVCNVCNMNLVDKPECADFHHNVNIKNENISFILRLSWDKVLDELKYCTLVCSNCHRTIHKKYDYNNEKLQILSDKLIEQRFE